MAQASHTPLASVYSTRKFRWTLAGRVRLGKIIQASLDYNRRLNDSKGIREGDPDWRPDRIRRLARLTGLANHVSLRNLVAGAIASQNDEILRAIAPYCYRLVRFEIERNEIVGIVLDYTKTYGENWEELAAIGEIGETFDHEVISPANLSVEMAKDLLETLRDLHKFIPVLEELTLRDRKVRQRFKQGEIMEDASAREISRSFRAAVETQGLSAPSVLTIDSPETVTISNLFQLEPASVVAIYNGDRLPSVYEIEALVDSGYLLKPEPDGELYTIQELLNLIDPRSTPNHRSQAKNGTKS